MLENYNIYSALIDAIALTIIIVFSFLGAKNGFVKTFFTAFGSLISLLLAVLLCKSVANFLEYKYQFITSVSKWLNGILTKAFGDSIMNTTLGQANAGSLASGGLTSWLITIVLSVKANGSIPTDVTLNQIICPVFAYYVVCGIAILGLYIIFRIIFYILGETVKNMHSIKVVAFVDVNLGWLLGILRALIIIQFALIIISIIPLGFVQDIYSYTLTSIVGQAASKINVFTIILNSLAKLDVINVISNFLK